MAKKDALGKGLGALLPQIDTDSPDDVKRGESTPGGNLYDFEERRRAGRMADISIAAIQPNPYQPRKEFDEAALVELAASIKQLGIVQPLTVRDAKDGKYELISGERRLRAAKLIGLRTVPAFVREADSETVLEMALVENVQREDLNPLEVAFGYQILIEEVELTQEQVAEKVGKSRSAVANMLRLLKLPPPAQAALRDGQMSVGHARMLVSIEDADDQLALLEAIIEKGLTVRDVEKRVRQLRKPTTTPSKTTKTEREATSTDQRTRLQLEAFEKRLRDHLSTKVRISHRSKTRGGTIQIEFYSDDDLERLMEMIAEDR